MTIRKGRISKKTFIISMSISLVSVLSLSLGLGLGLGLKVSSTIVGNNPSVLKIDKNGYYDVGDANTFGYGEKEYFDNRSNWNFTYSDEASSAKIISLPNENAENTNSNIMYQMLVYGFSDGNNDGVGDFIGARERLPYLKDLGVGSIWLSPIHYSPSYHSYDVMDFTSVSSEFGGMKAFDDFLKEAHELGIRIYLDMVFNHTSARHPWFAKAIEDPTSKYRKYYQFLQPSQTSTTAGYDGNERKISSARAAGYDSDDKYYTAFQWHGMPDLNLSNPNVILELENVIKFWVKKGVDGFRFDAFKHFFETGEKKGEFTTEKIFAELKTAANSAAKDINRKGSDIQFMGEGLGIDFVKALQYMNYENGEEIEPALDGIYDDQFWTGNYPIINQTTADRIIAISNSLIEEGKKTNPERNIPFIPYLDNHDTERWLVAARRSRNIRFAGDINDLDKSLLKSALLTLSMMPGRPIIYQGDELGYHARKKSDPYVREPLSWNGENPIKFKDYSVYNNFLPYNDSDPIELTESKDVGTADENQGEPNSIFNNLKSYLRIRAENSWLEKVENPLIPLSTIEEKFGVDGGIRKNLKTNEEIIWIGSNVFRFYNNQDFVSQTYDFSKYLSGKKVEVLQSSSGSIYDEETKIAKVTKLGTLVLKIIE